MDGARSTIPRHDGGTPLSHIANIGSGFGRDDRIVAMIMEIDKAWRDRETGTVDRLQRRERGEVPNSDDFPLVDRQIGSDALGSRAVEERPSSQANFYWLVRLVGSQRTTG